MTSCSLLDRPQIVQVQTKYTLSKPVILEAPTLTPLKLDPVIVITPEDAQYYREACEAFSEASVSNSEDTPVGYIGLDLDSACNWSIYGYTVQGWLNLEQRLLLIKSYIKEVESQSKFYQDQLLNQYENVKDKDVSRDP